MRWRITLLRLVRSRWLLRSVLRRAGVDETVRHSCFLPAPWSRWVAVAACLIGLSIGVAGGVEGVPSIAIMSAVLVIFALAFNRTLIIVGDSQVSVVEASGVAVLSPSAVLFVSRHSRSRWSKWFGVAVADGESRWSGQLTSDRVVTALEAEWQRLGLRSKPVVFDSLGAPPPV